ncbi:hypothetical protein SDC9_38244 [bioreactor metagenome]|uniref:Uncharacterized protein n=1 Tax=bioreactor metagenome TaxID=1076179 RepID=A0A644VLM8_9ZZZZ
MTVQNNRNPMPRLPGVRRADSLAAPVGQRSHRALTARQTVTLAIGTLALVTFIVGLIHSGALAFIGATIAFMALLVAQPKWVQPMDSDWCEIFWFRYDYRTRFFRGTDD